MKPKIKLTVFDAQKLEDITDSIDDFELKESNYETIAWITINGERMGLCPKRDEPINDVYSIRMTDDKGNETLRMLEVADEIQYLVPVHLSNYALKQKVDES